MILETIVSTLDESGAPNFAPMGIELAEDSITVRPFRSTQTCRNMLSSGYGVVNFTDDALAYVQCGLYDAVLPNFPAQAVPGVVFHNACFWHEVAVVSRGGSDERAELHCRVLHKGLQKNFLGFCRAGNAVIEATILASRLSFFDSDAVNQKMIQYSEIVNKTGGISEKQAIELIQNYIQTRRRDD
jgi:uncharacterized protein